MASIARDSLSQTFHIRFRYAGRSFRRSLKTKNERTATAMLARVEELIRLIEAGHVKVPLEVDPGRFILSDGKSTAPIEPRPLCWSSEFAISKCSHIHRTEMRFNTANFESQAVL